MYISNKFDCLNSSLIGREGVKVEKKAINIALFFPWVGGHYHALYSMLKMALSYR